MTAFVNQGELFSRPSFAVREALIDENGCPAHLIIGCGKSKGSTALPACELYASPRFRSSRLLAEKIGSDYFILSGKHGLMEPNRVVDPYDVNISNESVSDRLKWADIVLREMRINCRERKITILAEEDYTQTIMSVNNEHPYPLNICSPWENLNASDRGSWLSQARSMAARLADIRVLYAWINNQRKSGNLFVFSALQHYKTPQRGVYIFLDTHESNFERSGPRIVRVGTHAVSLGSKTSLRTRLRNHLGPKSGVGNHRGSIFRLHVGRALIQASGKIDYSEFWGVGQAATQDIKTLEASHEQQVTRYLEKLEVAVVPVLDDPSKNSLRAIIEAQLIALCTEGLQTIDVPSLNWLGKHSPIPQIRNSGLWNIRAVGRRYDTNGPGSVHSFVGN